MAVGDDVMYVDNDKEDQDFTAMKEPDQKKIYMFLLMKLMIQRMIYLTSIDICELDQELSDPSNIQSTVFYNLNITCQIADCKFVVANHLLGRKKYG